MARPRQSEHPVQISITTCLDKDDFEMLEQIKEAQKLGRSTILRLALRQYAQNLEKAVC